MSRTVEELEHALQLAERKAAELQAWVDSADDESERLRRRAEENDAAALQNRVLLERVSELEAVNHSLRHLNAELGAQVGHAASRDKLRLEQQLDEARAAGGGVRVQELEAALEEANEALATLEVQKDAAVDQVKRYVQGDEARHVVEESAHQRRIVELEAQLGEKEAAVALATTRLAAHEREEHKLTAEVSALRERACTAEEKLGRVEREADTLRLEKGALESHSSEVERKLDEARRWLAQGELDTAALEQEVAALKEKVALSLAAPGLSEPVEDGPTKKPATKKPAPGLSEPVEDGPTEPDLEGFSAQRLHRLEALLAAEQLKNAALARYAQTSDVSLRKLQEELEGARAQVLAMAQRLGLAEHETSEALERLEAARREAKALLGELTSAQTGEKDPDELDPEDVLEAPLDALEALSTQQASTAKEATDALAAEQRARDHLVADLSWLKGELEKLSHVREDLRTRIAAMVKRELARKQVVTALLEKLRSTEVASAARAGTLRRLQAAMEHAQKAAVRVQTIYFQKQIGSLQRQLEKKKRA